MKKNVFRPIFAVIIFFFSFFASATDSGVASEVFVQGAKALRSGEWVSAVFQLRKAVTYPENNNDGTWYMLIASEMYAGEYKNAFQDSEFYLKEFPESEYISHVLYHKGRALFCLGEYERSVQVLSDFCHQYPEHDMYAAALYWIAESFFAGYHYDEAKVLYETVLNEYPSDAKANAARYRIDTIEQKSREEKLLYLLKETGEEYLAAKEEYERQLKYVGAENSADTRRRLLDLQKSNAELEKKVQDLQKNNDELNTKLAAKLSEEEERRQKSNQFILELKRKAMQAQNLLDEKEAEKAAENNSEEGK